MLFGLLPLVPPEIEVGGVACLDRVWQKMFGFDFCAVDFEDNGDSLGGFEEIEDVFADFVHDPVHCSELEYSSDVYEVWFGVRVFLFVFGGVFAELELDPFGDESHVGEFVDIFLPVSYFCELDGGTGRGELLFDDDFVVFVELDHLFLVEHVVVGLVSFEETEVFSGVQTERHSFDFELFQDNALSKIRRDDREEVNGSRFEFEFFGASQFLLEFHRLLFDEFYFVV